MTEGSQELPSQPLSFRRGGYQQKIRKTDRPAPELCPRQTHGQVKGAQSGHSYCPSLLRTDVKAFAKTEEGRERDSCSEVTAT